MKIKVFGDSHSKYFHVNRQLTRINPNIAGHQIGVEIFKGATVGGFGKRESTLNVKEFINKNYLENDIDFYIFNFGQVDLELGYFYKRYIKKESIKFSDFITAQASTLVSWILGNMDVEKCVVKGVNVPVLCFDQNKAINYTKRIITENLIDSKSIDEALSDMKKTFPNDLERTQMALRYNHELASQCKNAGLMYFDINHALVDTDSKVVQSKYMPASLDHHLVDSVEVRALHINTLLNCIYNSYEF